MRDRMALCLPSSGFFTTREEIEEQSASSFAPPDMYVDLSARPATRRVQIRPLAAKPTMILLAGVALIFVDLALGGLVMEIDQLVNQAAGPFVSKYDYSVADWLDKFGQASVAGILPLVVSIAVARRLNSVRPVVVACGGWTVMYGVVGVVKITTMRSSPRTGGPGLFEEGNLFPSGHTANIVFMFGIATALMVRYLNLTRRRRIMLIAAVPLAFAAMGVVSIHRHTHWFSDVVVGGMIGAIALDLCMRADTCWPFVQRRLIRSQPSL